MQCSVTTLFLTLLMLLGTGMYIGAGWVALDNTLALFKQYGPVEGRGNPALDEPPQYWVNPKTGKWESINYNNRGNLVPQVFRGVQYYLIALAVFMTINAIIFMGDSVRSKKAVRDRSYQGKLTGLTQISCTGWLAGYSCFIAIWWMVNVGFGVLPLVEWVITMQRCWDLENPNWSPGTAQAICIDLVQYGLVFFKETADDGYGLICGPGGNYNPPLGDLKGLCDNYYPTFTLYLVSFVGACIVLFSQILFGLRHASNFVYLKVRRYENPAGPPGMMLPPQQPTYTPAPYSNYGNSVHNPNYENNVLLLDPERVPNNIELDSYGRRTPGNEAIEMKDRYYDQGDHRGRVNSKRYSRSSSYGPDDPVPAYGREPPSYNGSRRHRRHSRDSLETPHRHHHSDDSDRKARSRDELRHHSSDEDYIADRKPSRHRDAIDDSDQVDSSDHTRSTIGYRPKPLKRKARGAKSDPDIFRQSSRSRRKKAPKRDEYESPPSDYYIQEDLQRRSHRTKNRARSVV